MAMKNTLMVALGALTIALLGACGSTPAEEAVAVTTKAHPLPEQVLKDCKIGNVATASVADGGKTVTMVVGTGPGRPGASDKAAQCVYDAIGLPPKDSEQMKLTSSSDGWQKDSWDGYEASWKYSKSLGLIVTITQH